MMRHERPCRNGFGDGVTSFRIRVRPKKDATKAKAWYTGFNATQTRRRLSQWMPAKGTINQLIAQGGELMRDRSRDLVRNNPHAASGQDSYVGNLIGTGIKPSSLIKDPVLREEVAKLWKCWTYKADADGLCDFYGLQELVARALFEAGECFIRFRSRRPEDGLEVPLQLLVLESDMLDYPYNLIAQNGNIIMNGVEFDHRHKRLADHDQRHGDDPESDDGRVHRLHAAAGRSWFGRESGHLTVPVDHVPVRRVLNSGSSNRRASARFSRPGALSIMDDNAPARVLRF